MITLMEHVCVNGKVLWSKPFCFILRNRFDNLVILANLKSVNAGAT